MKNKQDLSYEFRFRVYKNCMMLGSSCKYFLQAFEQVKTTKTKVWRRKIWEIPKHQIVRTIGMFT